MAATTEPKTKPVRGDLVPAVHKALKGGPRSPR
jgi:hypothetical protein